MENCNTHFINRIFFLLQVKVWFQNRRTKHKRVLQEEDGKEGSGDNSRSSPSNANYEEDDELIDMDDCPSDDESDNA